MRRDSWSDINHGTTISRREIKRRRSVKPGQPLHGRFGLEGVESISAAYWTCPVHLKNIDQTKNLNTDQTKKLLFTLKHSRTATLTFMTALNMNSTLCADSHNLEYLVETSVDGLYTLGNKCVKNVC